MPLPPISLRIALRVLQLAAVAIVVAASTHRLFDLDRFFVPKELTLHLAAAIAGLLTIGAFARRTTSAVDRLLGGFLLLSALSTILATNRWAGLRALTITASSLLIYWIATAVAEAGLSRKLLNALALAVVTAAAISLSQAYGAWIDLFSINRAPGGTLGNRNFVAHAAAFGFPLVMLAALRARRLRGSLAASLGVAAVTAVLVLSRSRGAWLAFAAMAAVFAFAMLFSRALRSDRRGWARIALVLLFIGGGVAAALLIPNTLRWRSDNPYLESIRDVANYEEGSGRGRLIQYGRSMVMAIHHPLLGVGPGNWAVRYPEHASRRDPSLSRAEAGVTNNPWPSSDWVAFVSERGIVATFLLGFALLKLALDALRKMRTAPDAGVAFSAAALVATIVAAVVAGMFDAVLLLALPGFLVWGAIGALAANATPPEPAVSPFQPESVPPTPGVRPLRLVAIGLAVVLALVGVWRSGSQLVAMELHSYGDRASLRRAAAIDPGAYRVHLRLARSGPDRCEHALAARALYPNAENAKRLSRRCD